MPTYKAVTPIVAYAGFTKQGDFKLVPLDQLKMLDGMEYNEESFLEHMDQPLASLLKKASGIKLSLNEGNDVLTAVTYFESAKDLSEQELEQLKSYYYGQMCDGIGENLLSELKQREDVGFRLEVYGLYESDMGSQLQKVT